MERVKRDLYNLYSKHKKRLPYAGAILAVLVIYSCSKAREIQTRIYETKSDFKDARILGNDSVLEGKDKLFSKNLRDVQAGETENKESIQKILNRLEELEKQKVAEAKPSAPKGDEKGVAGQPTGVTPANFDPKRFPNEAKNRQLMMESAAMPRPKGRPGKQVISFPVKEAPIEKPLGVVLPSGSYVKAKLLTGVEAPEGKTFPVLLQLDYAYIIPNQKRLDLSGCFMIAKSQGDLSTERVQMQASKLSCVSKTGKMFERDVSGFVADDADNSFAVMGSVNSKQGRVASTAFLSSIVEGVGKAIQQAQTTQQVNPLGGSSSVVTGDQAAYLGAGGAANAAGLVTQWYLKQAQNLLPTINVGSGQDVWVVMQEKVGLPTEYFKNGGESDYSYLSRIID